MFDVRDDGPLPGLGHLVAAAPGAEVTEALVDAGVRAVQTAGLPIAATMGFSLTDLHALVERVLLRRLVRELPEDDVSMPWFEAHVPPGGSMSLRTSESNSSGGSLELKLYGAGFGAGRKVSISVSSSSPPRDCCASFALDLRVRPRVYALRGRESVELEVVSLRGRSVVSHEHCPYCGVAPALVDPFLYRLGDHVDLRRDKVAQTQKMQLSVDDSLSIEFGTKLPSLPVELKLGAKAARTVSYELECQFPPGALYLPYTRVGAGPVQTPMWAVEREA